MDQYYNSISSWWVFMLLIATLETMNLINVESFRGLDKNSFGPKRKGTVKTIEDLKSGQIIDCVDIYKQPALNNLPIKELQMKPSSYPKTFNKTNDRQPRILQTWNKYGECPDGTIPILRTWNNNDTTHPKTINNVPLHEYATVIHDAHKSRGAKARLNLWQPEVAHLEFSLSQMWITAGRRTSMNSIKVGWQVYPNYYGTPQTTFFIFYTPDGYKTACYNLNCDGFIHLDKSIVIGGPFDSVSAYYGDQIDKLISVSRDESNGNWYLLLDDTIVGYFLGHKLPLLVRGADAVMFGGEVINMRIMGHHTVTKMGSGYFPDQGYGKACYTSNIEVLNDDHQWVEPNLRLNAVTKPLCYNIKLGPLLTNMGTHIYFGGRGWSPFCLS